MKSLALLSLAIASKKYMKLRDQIHILPLELRSKLNLEEFERVWWNPETCLPKVEISNGKKEERFHFHQYQELDYSCGGLDEYKFSTMIDHHDRKRLLVITSLNNLPYEIEYTPTLPRYGCMWYLKKRAYHHRSGRSGEYLALSRFITQNPYIDYILSYSKAVVRYPREIPECGIGGISYRAGYFSRIEKKLEYLHLISTSRKIKEELFAGYSDFYNHCPITPFVYNSY